MHIRFQADADLNQRIVLGLTRREPALDFRSALESALFGLSHTEVLVAAARESRLLVSNDGKTMPRHYATFLRQSSSPGLIIVPQSLDVRLAIDDLRLIWAATEPEEWLNQIGFLPL